MIKLLATSTWLFLYLTLSYLFANYYPVSVGNRWTYDYETTINQNNILTTTKGSRTRVITDYYYKNDTTIYTVQDSLNAIITTQSYGSSPDTTDTLIKDTLLNLYHFNSEYLIWENRFTPGEDFYEVYLEDYNQVDTIYYRTRGFYESSIGEAVNSGNVSYNDSIITAIIVGSNSFINNIGLYSHGEGYLVTSDPVYEVFESWNLIDCDIVQNTTKISSSISIKHRDTSPDLVFDLMGRSANLHDGLPKGIYFKINRIDKTIKKIMIPTTLK